MGSYNSTHEIAAYAGYIQDEQELMQCTSGGVATTLARKMIRMGGYVAGVTYSDDFYSAQYTIIDREDQLDKLKGSKYIEVEKGNIYKDVKELLDAGKSVLFFGLPCVVGAMNRYLGKDYPGFLSVELICHGPTSAKVHRQYVEHLEGIYNSKVVDFSVRRKREKWQPPYLYARFETGVEFWEKLYRTEYGYAFSTMARPVCYTCKFRGDNRTGDMMIGDFWGATEKDACWNEKGISSILVHTHKADQFLKDLDGFVCYETTVERIIAGNENVIRPRKKAANTEKFEKLFEKYDLFYAVEHSRSFKSKVKRAVKKLIFKAVKKK